MSTDVGDIATRSEELPPAIAQRGVTLPQWRTLCNSLFPGANPNSVAMVIDYCSARKLDVMKKPCHIVPISVKTDSGWVKRDVVMPGIYELRTTAQRTGHYLGHSKPEYGASITFKGVTAPEWCEMTFYRHSAHGRIEFPVRRYFVEVVGLDRDGKANDRWSRSPIQMLEKCVEAAGLREAFPDEFGGEQTAEEMDDQRGAVAVDAEARPAAILPAQRKSQAVEPVASSPAKPEPAAEAKPGAATVPASPIGIIKEIEPREQGTMIRLDSGFVCGTRDPKVINAAVICKQNGERVQLVCTMPQDPTKHAAKLIEIAMPPEPTA